MITLNDGDALVLRTCDKNLQSRGGFQWPESGRVEAPDRINEHCEFEEVIEQ